MKIRIQESSSENLCTTCRNGTYLKGHRGSEEVIWCANIGRGERVPFPVRSCTEYDDRRDTELYEMRKTAWIIASDRKGQLGFYSQREYERRKKAGELVANGHDDD